MFEIENQLSYYDNREQHASYYELMEDCPNNELFEEILLFMDASFPDWKTNNNLGYWAADFVLDMVNLYDSQDATISFREMLVNLYPDLAEEYNSRKLDYNFTFKESILQLFENNYEEELEENNHLSEKDYNAWYDNLYNSLLNERLKETPYNFIDDFVI